MSNPPGLRSLVDSLDDVMVTRHADLMAALAAILDGLGIPPPTATTTLADVQVTLLATQALLESDLVTISGQLQQIYDLLANSIAPNVENVFFGLNDLYLLQLASANPKLPELISIVDLPSESELLHCQRVQWMIDEFFGTWMSDIAIHLGALEGVAVSIAMAALVVGTAGIGAIPLAVLSAGAGAVIQVQDLGALKNDATIAKRAALRQALYAAPNAAAAQEAWNTTIEGFTDGSAAVRLAWRVLIWSDWFNHLYDPIGHNSTTEPGSWDLTGYDGAICAPPDTGCIQLTSTYLPSDPSGMPQYRVIWPSPFTTTDYNWRLDITSAPNWTIRLVSGGAPSGVAYLYYPGASPFQVMSIGDVYNIGSSGQLNISPPDGTGAHPQSGSIVIEMCPPPP